MEQVSIPDKIFFRIGEVSDLTGIAPSVLRYWESRFGTLRPQKSPSNQRLYSRSDVEKVLRLKTLLYEKRLTIDGARRVLAKGFERELAQIEGAPKKPGPPVVPFQAAPAPKPYGAKADTKAQIGALISKVQSIKDSLA
ncbi:MAG: MerR family transcriptional regulator [Bdellovibrionota bacterium]